MNRKELEERLSQTKTFMMTKQTPRVDLLMKQIRLLDRFLKDGNALVSGPCLLFEFEGVVQCKSFSGRVVVGRDVDADLSIDTPGLSRKHFSLACLPEEGTVVEDLGSKNKTLVNDEEVESTLLVPGDVINAGDVLFIYLED